ncbi:hypothetical protein HYPGJ_21085 [Hyphomicrobium sp. GJ21]|nr:hypothetical protein HYPGJ_21085 [Hyphomicrobium sp. GJ21]
MPGNTSRTSPAVSKPQPTKSDFTAPRSAAEPPSNALGGRLREAESPSANKKEAGSDDPASSFPSVPALSPHARS